VVALAPKVIKCDTLERMNKTTIKVALCAKIFQKNDYYWPYKCLKFVIIILMSWHKQGYEERSLTVCVSTMFRTPRQSVLAHTVEEPHVLAHTTRGAPKI
jgi:hypothetical protein